VITRDVEASAVADLALSPPRAALAASGDDGVILLPVRVTLEDPGDPASSPRIVHVGQGQPDLYDREVVVIADDGPQWFRLRSLTVRGTAKALEPCTFRVVPRRVVAWDYGSLRQVPTPAGGPSPPPPSFSASDDKGAAEPLCSPNLEAALHSSRVMILASRSGKGTPFAVPLWFVTHRGRLYTTTSSSSWTVRNVVASPQVALMLGGERREDASRLVVSGQARALRRAPPPVVVARIAWLYYLQPQFAAVELSHIRSWATRLRYYAQSRAAYVVITPQSATECRAP